jgi:Bacterial Ig-like domain/Fibronectin type III domain
MKKLLTCFLIALLMACDNTPANTDTTPPTMPNGFKATPGNATIKLEWTANTESDLEKYTLHWGSNAAEQNAVETIVSPKTSFDLTGLINGTTYFFKLEASDKTGNTSSSTSLKSAIPTAPDTTVPTLTLSIPALNASAVPLSTQVQLTFSKTMNINTVTTSSSNLTLGTAVWSAGNTVVNFVTPTLQNDTTYTILLNGKDSTGNNLGGATTLQFSSVPAAPTLTSSTPINNAIDVPIASKISLHFSKPMNKTSIESAFSSNPSVTCIWLWTDSDQTATCTPNANLEFLTEYNLTLASSAKSASDVALANPFLLHFTTVQDTIKPALTSYAPSDPGTFATAFNAPITLNFSKAMNQTSLENAFSSSPNIACTWTWTTPSSASCQPIGRLTERTTYTVTLSISATDLIGNNLQTAYGFDFSVGNAPPKVISFSPIGKFGFESLNTPVVINFSEQMHKTLTENAFLVRVNGFIKTGTITWNANCTFFNSTWVNCKQMTYTPSTPYPTGSVVTWSISTSATDNAEQQSIENMVTGSFQTIPTTGGI